MGEITNLKQLKITRRWARGFKRSASAFPTSEALEAVNPIFWRLVRDAAKSMFQDLNNQVSTYLWKKKMNWVR